MSITCSLYNNSLSKASKKMVLKKKSTIPLYYFIYVVCELMKSRALNYFFIIFVTLTTSYTYYKSSKYSVHYSLQIKTL